ncbi:MAG TPA: nucleotidyltransferase family protein [Tissierellia bacterium]|nr:nucleotidyltransferase family protein [Tissierellia bacterium]
MLHNPINQCIAIVMAAGVSKRYGERKLYQKLGDKAIIDHVLDELKTTELKQVVVVVQPGDELETPFLVVSNPDYVEGQSTSIRAGLAAAAKGWAGVFFCPADQPFLDAAVMEEMAQKLSHGKIIVPRYQGRNGSPVLFSHTFLEELRSLHGEEGGRPVIRAHPEALIYHEVKDKWMLHDIDTSEDLEEAKKVSERTLINKRTL